MNGTFFYIGLGLGLAAACGLRPYLPALLAGALGSAGALGVGFGPSTGHYHFLQANWWLLAVTIVLAGAYLLQLRLGSERFDTVASGAIAAQSIAVGALLFGGTLAAHGNPSWPGLIGGAAAAACGPRIRCRSSWLTVSCWRSVSTTSSSRARASISKRRTC